jgi:hypothetical protein
MNITFFLKLPSDQRLSYLQELYFAILSACVRHTNLSSYYCNVCFKQFEAILYQKCLNLNS